MYFRTTYVLRTGPTPFSDKCHGYQTSHTCSIISSFYSDTASTGKTAIARLLTSIGGAVGSKDSIERKDLNVELLRPS